MEVKFHVFLSASDVPAADSALLEGRVAESHSRYIGRKCHAGIRASAVWLDASYLTDSAHVLSYTVLQAQATGKWGTLSVR
jgi:hypothetical protein